MADEEGWPPTDRQSQEWVPLASLAVLVRCSLVSQHWSAAAQPAASKLSGLCLPACVVLPLLGTWVEGWPGLHLQPPASPENVPALTPFLQAGCTSLERPSVHGVSGHTVTPALAEALQANIAQLPKLVELHYHIHRPTSAFPEGLLALSIASRFRRDSGKELLALLVALPVLLSDLRLELSALRIRLPQQLLARVELPSQLVFRLCFSDAYETSTPDLSWLATSARIFQLGFGLSWKSASDGLLAFCQPAASVSHPGHWLLLLPHTAAEQSCSNGTGWHQGPVALLPRLRGRVGVAALPEADIIRLHLHALLRPKICVGYVPRTPKHEHWLSWHVLPKHCCRIGPTSRGSQQDLVITDRDGRIPNAGPWHASCAAEHLRLAQRAWPAACRHGGRRPDGAELCSHAGRLDCRHCAVLCSTALVQAGCVSCWVLLGAHMCTLCVL